MKVPVRHAPIVGAEDCASVPGHTQPTNDERVSVVAAADLKAFVAAILRSVDVPHDDAALVADSLVVADEWGHQSHGVLRLPWYYNRIRNGVVDPKSPVELLADHAGIAILDGRDGVGQVIAARAMTEAVTRAKQYGIAAIAVRNSNHFGTAAYFTRLAPPQGCVGILATNGSPAMAPWGGRSKTIGANPWSIAAPAGRYGVAVLDIANTAVARGKIYLARQRGERIPDGWALDVAGMPTTDPVEALKGFSAPMGGHKGYAISFMIDVLAGVLTGSGFGTQVGGPYEFERRSLCGHLVIALDIAAFMPLGEFEARMEVLVREAKTVDTASGVGEVFFPGELEIRAQAQAERQGVVLPEKTLADLRSLATKAGVNLPPQLSSPRPLGRA